MTDAVPHPTTCPSEAAIRAAQQAWWSYSAMGSELERVELAVLAAYAVDRFDAERFLLEKIAALTDDMLVDLANDFNAARLGGGSFAVRTEQRRAALVSALVSPREEP